MKAFKAVNKIFFSLLLLITIAATLLVGTAVGNQTLLKIVSNIAGVDVKYNAWQGNILTSIAIHNLHITPLASDVSWEKVTCNSCQVTWDFRQIFKTRLNIEKLQLSGVDVFLNDNNDGTNLAEKPSSAIAMPSLDWPLTTTLNNVTIDKLSIYKNKQLIWNLPALKTDVKLKGDKVKLVAKGNRWGDIPFDAKISLRLHHDIDVEASVQLPWKNTPPSRIELSMLCRELSPLQCRGDMNWAELVNEYLSEWRSDGELTWQINDQLVLSKLQVSLDKPKVENSLFSFSSDLKVNIDQSVLTLSDSTLSRLDSEIKGSGNIDWRDGLLVDSQLSVNSIHPKVLSPLFAWPDYLTDLNIGGDIQLSYSSRDAQNPKASVAFTELNLISNEHRLQGQGALKWQQKNNKHHWHVSQWQLSGDESTIKADLKGVDQRVLAVKGNIHSNNLASWLEGVKGDLTAAVALNNGELSASAKSDTLTFSQWQGKKIQLKSELSLNQDEPWQQWNLSNLALQGELIKQVGDTGVNAGASLESFGLIKLLASGSAEKHQLQLSQSRLNHSDSDKFDITLFDNAQLALTGRWLNEEKWRAQLHELAVKPRHSERWVLQKPVDIILSQQQQQWQKLCLQRQSASGHLCLESGSLLNGQGRIALALQQWPLSRADTPLPWLYKALDQRWDFTGDISAESTIDLTQMGISGQGKVYSDTANLRYELEDESLQWPLNPAAISWQFDADNIRWQGRIAGTDKDQLVTQGWLQTSSNDWGIEASLDGRWSQLQTLQPLFIDTDELQGVLDIALKVKGSSARPILDGQVQLQQGSVLIPQSGTRLNNWNIVLNADGNAMDVQGQGLIGEGEAKIHGVLLDDSLDRRIHLQLQGSDLELINRTDLQLRSDINLVLAGAGLNWNVSGDVRVKNSSLELHELPQAAVHRSRDQVLVGEAQEPEKPLRVSADVQLILDNTVAFKGFGLESNIQGLLNFRQDDQQQQFAYGSLNLEDGFYKKYSQRLEIETGQLIFNGDINNPQIIVRAERDFNGVTVGLELGGSALEPESKLYSSEPMSDVDRLSYLISGRPMSEAGTGAGNEMQNAAIALGLSKTLPLVEGLSNKVGISSIGLENDNDNTSAIAVAKHLNEKLSIKYLYGLINNSARLVMEYRFNRNISVEASSGDSQAMDLRYRWFSDVPEL